MQLLHYAPEINRLSDGFDKFLVDSLGGQWVIGTKSTDAASDLPDDFEPSMSPEY
jgi:hypothetical protein